MVAGRSSHAGIAQLVERLLAMQKVAGSSPVSRFTILSYFPAPLRFSGPVAKW